jgi:hypothetical protein
VDFIAPRFGADRQRSPCVERFLSLAVALVGVWVPITITAAV